MIRYREGYKYELAEDYTITLPIRVKRGVATPWCILSDTGVLTICKGYPWDGPSGPAIDTKNFMRGSLVHDVLYEMMRQGLLAQSYRDQADRILQQICIEDGMWAIRAWWVYQAVRLAAGPMAKPENDRKVLEAP